MQLHLNRLNHGGSLLGAGADQEEGVVVLTPVSLAPVDLKTKHDNYQYNPTSVVKKFNQLGRKQTLNLVKKVCLKPVLCSKLSQFTPGITGSSVRKTVKDMFTENSGQSPVSVQVEDSRPHTSQDQDFPMRQVDHVNQDVFYDVATHAPSVATTRLPQKKGLSPVPVLRKIKHVSSVFLCRSISFCPNCSRCPHCCARWSCRRPSLKVLASLATVRRKPSSSVHFKGGLQPPIQVETSSHQGSDHSEQLCQSVQKPFPQRSLDLSPRKGGSRTSPGLVFSSLLQPAVFSPQTGKQVEAYFRSESVEQVPQNRHIQETPETIQTSLQKGEWVTSLDFSDAYFHIPIHPRSRKYMRFFLKKRAYQFTALPFGLATVPLKFTKVVKEVKLMAQNRGIRIHQYLDDWLLRAPSREIGLCHTQVLLSLCRELGWLVNIKKSELTPQQVFTFVGYWFDLLTGRVLPTQ